MGKKRGFLAEMQAAQKKAQVAADRYQREQAKARAAAEREVEKARRDAERAQAQADRAAAAEQKRLQKEAADAHVAAMQAEVEEKNLALEELYAEIDGLLAATLDVDDHVDLESLRSVATHPPFDPAGLDLPLPPPPPLEQPTEPVMESPSVSWQLVGRKKKQAEAQAEAERDFEERLATWRAECDAVEVQRAEAIEQREHEEAERLRQLDEAKAAYAEECAKREEEVETANRALDQLISNLGYGTASAIEEYVSIVAANSAYPDCFPVEYDPSFDQSSGELSLAISVPAPDSLPTIKAFKYTKSTDEITSSELSQKAAKDRYNAAVNQVALRALHEVFESDRRGLIQTISAVVSTSTLSPATGLATQVDFVAVAAERESFMTIDLAVVIPQATLEHLGAAVSKNPHGLVAISSGGVRKA